MFCASRDSQYISKTSKQQNIQILHDSKMTKVLGKNNTHSGGSRPKPKLTKNHTKDILMFH